MTLPFAALVVAAIFASAAALVSWKESSRRQGVEAEIECALNSAVGCLPDAQNDDLGAPVINARMSGLVEFIHGLAAVRDSEARTSTAPFLFVLAAGVILASAIFSVVDRVEERRERAACVGALARLQSSPTTLAPAATPGEMTREEQAEPGTAGTTNTTTAPPTPTTAVPPTPTTEPTPTTTSVTPPTLLPASEVASFLSACVEAASNQDNVGDNNERSTSNGDEQ